MHLVVAAVAGLLPTAVKVAVHIIMEYMEVLAEAVVLMVTVVEPAVAEDTPEAAVAIITAMPEAVVVVPITMEKSSKRREV
jgi:hypothetical protein